MHDNQYTEDSNITFSNFAYQWLDYYKTQVKISSVRARKRPLEHFINEWGKLALKDITKHMYQSYLNNLNKKYSYNYLDSIHTTGSLLFKYAINQELLSLNPTENFVMPKKRKTVEDLESINIKKKFFELDELKEYLNIVDMYGKDFDYLASITLIYTGLRAGELLALKWSDINFEENTIRITKTYYNPNNNYKEFELLTPKSEKSIRTIHIDDRLIKLLKQHKIEQEEMKNKQKFIYKDMNFIFAENTGYPRVYRKLASRLEKVIKIMDTDKTITLHSFRHTHTTLLIEAGAGIKEIQDRLGHADINTTMNIYAHLTKSVEKKTSDKFKQLTRDLL